MTKSKRPKTTTISALATATGFDRRTIERRLAGLEPVRTEQRGGRTVRHFDARAARKLATSPGAEAVARAEADAAGAELAELRAAIRDGTLVPRADVLQEVDRRAATFVAALDSLPGRHAAAIAAINRLNVSPNARRERIEAAIAESLAFARGTLAGPLA